MLHPTQAPGTEIGAVVRPATAHEALELLAADPHARPVAGGSDLLLELARTSSALPVTLIDLTAVDGFDHVTRTDDHTMLAGGVTHAQVVADEQLRRDALPLAQACLEIGSPQLRNRATVAGNLVTASPANDTISALLALGASAEIARYDTGSATVETRRLDLADFFTGFRTTALEDDELLTAVLVPHLAPGQDGVWVKVGLRRAQAISVVHLGLVVTRNASGIVTDARLALGSIAPTVILVPEVTSVLKGWPLTEEIIGAAAGAAADTIEPIDDIRATADYRRSITATAVRRALRAIATGEQGSTWPAAPPSLSVPVSAPAMPSTRTITGNDPITVTVNDQAVTARGGTETLLDWLREHAHPQVAPLSLSGVKEGCAEGECGACTVTLDGAAVMSCIVPAAQADGCSVTTIEGISGPADDDGTHALHPVQKAFVDEFAVQCGYCIPGFVMATERLLAEVERPDRDQIRLALSGNLCRCTGYLAIIEAVEAASS